MNRLYLVPLIQLFGVCGVPAAIVVAVVFVIRLVYVASKKNK